MNIKNYLRTLSGIFILFLSFPAHSQTAENFGGSKADRDSLINTGNAIRAAFLKGDADKILLYHHPEVIKTLNYNTIQKGIVAVKSGLKGTLDSFTLEFTENKIESLLINNGTAVEQTLFTIKGTPKAGGAPFIFKGRSMIVYVKYKGSPTGWATIREMIQPLTE